MNYIVVDWVAEKTNGFPHYQGAKEFMGELVRTGESAWSDFFLVDCMEGTVVSFKTKRKPAAKAPVYQITVGDKLIYEFPDREMANKQIGLLVPGSTANYDEQTWISGDSFSQFSIKFKKTKPSGRLVANSFS